MAQKQEFPHRKVIFLPVDGAPLPCDKKVLPIFEDPMCGIAGLFLKDAKLEPDLGSMLAGMLSPLNDRGPDSAGFAVYGAETPGHVKLTLRLPSTFDVDRLLSGLRNELGSPVAHRLHGTHVVLSIPAERTALARRALAD